MRTPISDTIKNEGKKLTVAGWLHARRDHGKIIFIDLRDMTGLLQVVFTPKNESLYKAAEELRPEWVVRISGTIKARPENMKNPDIATGDFELVAEEFEVLSYAETPPFPIEGDACDGNTAIWICVVPGSLRFSKSELA